MMAPVSFLNTMPDPPVRSSATCEPSTFNVDQPDEGLFPGYILLPQLLDDCSKFGSKHEMNESNQNLNLFPLNLVKLILGLLHSPHPINVSLTPPAPPPSETGPITIVVPLVPLTSPRMNVSTMMVEPQGMVSKLIFHSHPDTS